MAKRWTEKEEKRLMELYQDDVPDEEIASILNRTKNAINLKRSKLGITNIHKRRFTKGGLNNLRKSREKYKRENHPSWIGGKRINHNGYIEILLPEHHRARKNGYVFEHILFAEEKVGRKLNSDEVVHHKNEIKTDNRPSNLMIMESSKHTKIHSQGRRKGGIINCTICQTRFYVKPSRLKKAKCCSRQCAGKYGNLKRKGELL